MRLKTQLNTVRKALKQVRSTDITLELIWANLQVKLCNGLMSTLSHVEKVTSKIRWAGLGIQSRAKETIALHRIKQIKPVQFTWKGNQGIGVVAQTIGQLAPSLTTVSTVAAQTSAFTFQSANNKPVLIIRKDGEVEWHGKPSEAAEIMVKSFQFSIEDKQGITKAARRRYYLAACKNILNKAETMQHEEFIDFLKTQVYNKERRVIIDSLKGEKNDTIN